MRPSPQWPVLAEQDIRVFLMSSDMKIMYKIQNVRVEIQEDFVSQICVFNYASMITLT